MEKKEIEEVFKQMNLSTPEERESFQKMSEVHTKSKKENEFVITTKENTDEEEKKKQNGKLERNK